MTQFLDVFEKETEKDKKYIADIAKSLKVPVKKLNCIMGIDEFKTALKNLKSENFNPNSATYCANFHTHTVFSDGKATPKDILDEAQYRAESSGKTFYIGLNDHDTLSGAKNAIKTIVQYHEFYKNIKVEIGVEPCFCYENSDFLKCPIPFDALLYCVNPFEEKTASLFEKYTEKNIEYAKLVMDLANQKWGINANYEDSCKFHCLLKTGGSSGFFKFTRLYIEKLLKEKGLDIPREKVFALFKPYCLNQNGRATVATINIKNAIEIIKSVGYSEIGLAHPALIEINPKFENGCNFSTRDNLQDGKSYKATLSEFIDTCGLNIIELNYQYPQKMLEKYVELQSIIDCVNKTCQNKKILKSGGTDSHGGVENHILEGRF